jgi:hypothetical protein
MGLVRDGQLDISEMQWQELNEAMEQQEIIQLISDTIHSHNIPLPMREITLKDVHGAFALLEAMDDTALIRHTPWFTRYDYQYPFTDTVIGTSNVGNVCSDYFHQENRWKCDSINSPSPVRTWETEKFRLTLLKGLWSLKYKKIDTAGMRSLIGLRKYIAAQFRPSAAKAVYNHFQAKNVLDFSSGWGDRLMGFFASNAETYVGIDPNTALQTGYRQEIEELNSNKGTTMIVGCAEEPLVYPANRTYDLVFTSPPYFNIERYSKDPSQSFARYKKIDQWLNEFLFKAIYNAWDRLEVGGHMVINISDVYSGHTINKICDPMNDFIVDRNTERGRVTAHTLDKVIFERGPSPFRDN